MARGVTVAVTEPESSTTLRRDSGSLSNDELQPEDVSASSAEPNHSRSPQEDSTETHTETDASAPRQETTTDMSNEQEPRSGGEASAGEKKKKPNHPSPENDNDNVADDVNKSSYGLKRCLSWAAVSCRGFNSLTTGILFFLALFIMAMVVVMVTLFLSDNSFGAAPSETPPADDKQTSPAPSFVPKDPPTPSHNEQQQQPEPPAPAYWEKVGTKFLVGEKPHEHFAYDISMSANGTIVAGGAPFWSSRLENGLVRIFSYNGEQWQQLGTTITGEQAGDQLGSFISLSADGTMVAASSADRITRKDKSGYVVAYQYDVNIGDWVMVGQPIKGVSDGDMFGYSAVLSKTSNGDAILAAGAIKNDGIHGNLTDCGHVRAFRLDRVNNEWKQLGQTLDGEAANHWFGESVALAVDDDGSTMILAAGSKFHDGPTGKKNVGQVRVFQYDAATNSWQPRGQELYGKATANHFGVSISLSSDGNVMAIGSDWQHTNTGLYSGSVSVFEFDTATNQWNPLGREIHGQKGYDEFGWRVALSGSGHDLVAGSPYHKVAEKDASIGQARVFHYEGDEWIQLGQSFESVAFSSREIFEKTARLGYSVAISKDGKTVAAGAPWADPAVGVQKAGKIRVLRAP